MAFSWGEWEKKNDVQNITLALEHIKVGEYGRNAIVLRQYSRHYCTQNWKTIFYFFFFFLFKPKWIWKLINKKNILYKSMNQFEWEIWYVFNSCAFVITWNISRSCYEMNLSAHKRRKSARERERERLSELNPHGNQYQFTITISIKAAWPIKSVWMQWEKFTQ